MMSFLADAFSVYPKYVKSECIPDTQKTRLALARALGVLDLQKTAKRKILRGNTQPWTPAPPGPPPQRRPLNPGAKISDYMFSKVLKLKLIGSFRLSNGFIYTIIVWLVLPPSFLWWTLGCTWVRVYCKQVDSTTVNRCHQHHHQQHNPPFKLLLLGYILT